MTGHHDSKAFVLKGIGAVVCVVFVLSPLAGALAASITWTGAVDPAWDIGTTANWTGGATFQNGDLVTFDDTATGATTVAITGSGVMPGSVTVNNTSRTYSLGGGAIDGTGGLTKTGSGLLILSGANTYSGLTTVSGGTLKLGNASALGTTAGKTVIQSGATLDIAGFSVGDERIEVSGSGVGGNGAIVNTAADQTQAFRNITLLGNTTLDATRRWDLRSGTFAVNGFKITKVGANVLSLVSSTVTNPGDVDVNAGLFRIEGSTNFNAATPATIRVANGAALDFWGTSIVHNQNIELSGGRVSANSSGTPSLSGTLTLNAGNNTIGAGNEYLSPTLTITGKITGVGGFTLNGRSVHGSGTLVFTNSANDYAGDTRLGTGTCKLGASEVLPHGTGKGNVVLDAGSVAAGTFDLNGYNETINGLSGTSGAVLGLVVNNALGTTKTLTVGGGNATATFAGRLNDNTGIGGVLTLTKIGTGTQTLAGTNEYSGATTVKAGVLALSGASTNNIANSSRVEVQSGAVLDVTGLTNGTLVLSSSQMLLGAGTLQGTLDAASGTTVSAGSSTGHLTITGDFLQTGTLLAEIGGTVPGSDYDWIEVQGTATLGGPIEICTVDSFTPSVGATFDILTAAGGITNADLSGITFTISGEELLPGTYWVASLVDLGNGAEALRLTLGVPEPSSLALLVGLSGMAGLGLLWRRSGGIQNIRSYVRSNHTIRARWIGALGVVMGLALASHVLAEENAAFVRVSPRDPHYFELSDGRPYLPIGLNMIGPPGDGLAGMETWFQKLSAQGGNFVRIWLSNPFFDVEHGPSGQFDPERGKRIEALVALAHKYGIRLKLCTEHFRHLGEGTQKWAGKPQHLAANGGPARDTADFFQGESGRRQYKSKLAWYADRLGSDPMIFGWELWNEMDAVRVNVWRPWSAEMLPELHRLFPKNLAMQSLGSYDYEPKRQRYRDLCELAGNDVLQVHRYLDLGARWDVCHDPVAVFAAEAVRDLRSFGLRKPVLLAESGAVEPNHSGPFKLYAKDRDGMLLHDVLFAPFFAGAAGPGHIWHWNVYVDANSLWWHFGRFAAAVKGLDPPAEAFEPFEIAHPELLILGLRGRRTTLLWCRDRQNTWQTELAEGRPPELRQKVRIDLATAQIALQGRTVKTYDPWADVWSVPASEGSVIQLPDFKRSIVLRVE